MHATGKAMALAAVIAVVVVCGCVSTPKPELTAGILPAEISATAGDEFSWRGHSYSVDRMADTIRSAKYTDGITSVVLLYDAEATVQDIIDVALIARAAGLPGFYLQDGKLSAINVSR